MKKILIAVCFLMLCVHSVRAEGWLFDEKMTYDIYLYSPEDKTSVIRDVKIERLESMGDVTFLIIRSPGFRIKDSVGFVRLDGVSAILPNSEMRLQDGQKIEVRY